MSETRPKITSTSFVLAVPDIKRTGDWWVEVMGFALEMEPDGWRFVARDGCRVMLGECPDAIPPVELGDHQYFGYIEMDDIDAYHKEVAPRGADILFPPVDRPWGMREMGVRTPDGHPICFGMEIAG